MTAAELRKMQSQEKPREGRVKGTVRTEVDGVRFDSAAEAKRWRELQMMQMAGELSDLQRQVAIPLWGKDGPIMTDSGSRQRVYRADFVYFDHALGVTLIEDKKGYETEVFRLKRAILAAQGVEVLVT